MLTNRLPDLLDQNNISIRELARRTGITYTTIRAVVQGDRRSIQLDVLEKICQVLEIQPGDIYLAGESIRSSERPVTSVSEMHTRSSEIKLGEAKRTPLRAKVDTVRRHRERNKDWRTW